VKNKNKPNEKFADMAFNSRSLLEAYNQVTEQLDDKDTEFASDLGSEQQQQKAAHQEAGSASSALQETYAQAIDSYREGTIDQAEES
jgi:CHASE3 domain sensor protein